MKTIAGFIKGQTLLSLPLIGKLFMKNSVVTENGESQQRLICFNLDVFLLQADDLLFCYRWLLLEMKREFVFEDALRVMETLWASLPPTNPEGEGGLQLYEEKFVVVATKPDLGITLTPKRPGEMTFSKMVSLRRRTSSAGITIR